MSNSAKTAAARDWLIHGGGGYEGGEDGLRALGVTGDGLIGFLAAWAADHDAALAAAVREQCRLAACVHCRRENEGKGCQSYRDKSGLWLHAGWTGIVGEGWACYASAIRRIRSGALEKPKAMSEANKIVNAFDQCVAAGGRRLFISYRGCGDARMTNAPCWQVVLVERGKIFATDPRAHWCDRGCKTFLLGIGKHYEEKAAALRAAMAWTCKKYGRLEFARNRLGDYVERDVQARFPIPRLGPEK